MKLKSTFKTILLTVAYLLSQGANANTKAAQVTPYPETIEVKQIVSADKEQQRLRHAQRKFDHQVTGFYLAADKQLVLNVEVISAATNNALPKVVIGTPSRSGNTRTEISLTTGLNTITPSMHKGGMVYFRYVTDLANPIGKARVTFTPESQQLRAPHYIYGTTNASEFSDMMNLYQTPDVMFSASDAVVVISRAAALKYSLNADKDAWMQTLSNMLLAEDEISGLSNNDPNPLHHRLAPGVRHLFSEADHLYMFATDFSTGFCGDAALNRLLNPQTLSSNNWGIAHELGHQHQQGAYKTGGLTETTVNIYTLAVQRFFQGSWYTRSTESAWAKLYANYFSLDDTQRNYLTESITPSAANVNDARLFLFEQLHLIFGDAFYHRLHRITREEQVSGGSDEERIAYLVLKSCQLTGYDLRDYFKKWAVKLNTYNQSVVDKAIADAKLQKPSCNDQLYLTTPYFKPSGVPLPLIGITTSSPDTGSGAVDGVAAVRNYCNYSTKTGDFTDLRDNKTYAYKKYGAYEWFMQNLDWDGFDGLNDLTKGTVGLYGSDDPDGSVFGRMYPTNATSANYAKWCPTGWTTPTVAMWDALMTSIKNEYALTDTDLTPCLKCGGDKDEQVDGLWNKGAGTINATKAAQVGFNALPAGVFNKDNVKYDDTDKPGLKASFYLPNTAWFHKVISNASDAIAYPNRNTRHHASIRCVRIAPSGVSSIQNELDCFVYIDDASLAHVVSSTLGFSVEVYDLFGRLIFASKEQNSHLVVNTHSWRKGVYIIKVVSGNKRKNHKILL